jgi:hypothetical protein
VDVEDLLAEALVGVLRDDVERERSASNEERKRREREGEPPVIP